MGIIITKMSIRMAVTSNCPFQLTIRMPLCITKIVPLKVNKKKNRNAIVPVEKSLPKLGFSLELKTRSSFPTILINMMMEQLVDS